MDMLDCRIQNNKHNRTQEIYDMWLQTYSHT